MRQRVRLSLVATAFASAQLLAFPASAYHPERQHREGGILRVGFAGLDFIDPALSYTISGWTLLDTSCARLMAYPDKPPPAGFRLAPEVAAAFPRISPSSKIYTFTLRRGFRFSDGTPVRANAFARAINRVLASDISPGRQYAADIAGAADVLAGKATSAEGVVARGNTLVVRFTRPTLDFAAKTTMPFFCAVPPTLPVDPEGVGAFPGSGPYYVKEYRPGERVVIRRNRFYGGTRPHHVDGFDVDLRPVSSSDVLDRIERGDADWGWASTPAYFEPGRNLARKYGVNRSRFFVRPGFTLRYIAFNVARPLLRDNLKLRQGVNFAVDRAALVRAASSPLAERLTDQFLPPTFPAFKDADIYPLRGPNLRRARALARGNTRGGKATLYVMNVPPVVAMGQLVRRQLAGIGLEIETKALPPPAFLGALARPGEPWDLAVGTVWAPDFIDAYTYINGLFGTPVSRGGGNQGSFESKAFKRLMVRAARLRGPARDRAYGELDVRLVRDAAPAAAISIWTQPTLVSRRVGCIVLRPLLDLTAACVK